MKFLLDFFPILLFFIAYELYDIYAATVVAIAAGFAQVGYLKLRGGLERMHLITLALLVLFGGLTLLLRDPLFIMWKPSVVNWLFAAAFLLAPLFGGLTLAQRLMGASIALPAAVWSRLNLAWILFFVISGGLNLIVAFNFDEQTWVHFKLFGMLGLTLVFIIGQALYLSRHIQPPEPACSKEV